MMMLIFYRFILTHMGPHTQNHTHLRFDNAFLLRRSNNSRRSLLLLLLPPPPFDVVKVTNTSAAVVAVVSMVTPPENSAGFVLVSNQFLFLPQLENDRETTNYRTSGSPSITMRAMTSADNNQTTATAVLLFRIDIRNTFKFKQGSTT